MRFHALHSHWIEPSVWQPLCATRGFDVIACTTRSRTRSNIGHKGTALQMPMCLRTAYNGSRRQHTVCCPILSRRAPRPAERLSVETTWPVHQNGILTDEECAHNLRHAVETNQELARSGDNNIIQTPCVLMLSNPHSQHQLLQRRF